MFDHVALRVKNIDQAARLYAAMLAPQRKNLRTDHAPNYYAAFLIDFDGNNIEAVCMT